MKEIEKLVTAGFTKREAGVYEAILVSGRLTQTGIAEKTKSNRTTLYRHIHSLLQKGYISKTIRGKRLYYVAENPKKILAQSRKKQAILEGLIPELVALYKTSNQQPTVTTYEGSSGIEAAFAEAADTALYIKTFISPKKNFNVITADTARYFLKTTEEREVKTKGICNDSKEDREIMKAFKKENFETRIMPHGLQIPIEAMVYNQKVLIVSFDHQFAVLVESEDIRKFFENLFDYFWTTGSKL